MFHIVFGAALRLNISKVQLLIKNLDLCKVNVGENSLVLKDHRCLSLPY